MSEINAHTIAELRAKTGAGMMDCKKALEEVGSAGTSAVSSVPNGSPQAIEKAIQILRQRGVVKAAKRADKIAAEGLVASYIHAGGKIGVLLEVNCETDFVAKTDQFKQLVNDIAMQVAAANPKYLSSSDVPVQEIEKEKDIYRGQLKNEGKPAEIMERIVDGKMSKYYSEICLLNQLFVKDETKTIEQLLTEKTAEIGEKITVRRFVRFELGEGLEKKSSDFAKEVAKQMGQ